MAQEGWTPEHDDEQGGSRGGRGYLIPPGTARIPDLVKAGALIAAEIDRALNEADYHVIDGKLVCDNCAYEHHREEPS